MNRTCIALVALAGATMTTMAQEGQPERQARRAGGGNPGAIIERLDKNGDGKLSEDEVPGGFWDRLSEADIDGDGALTLEEIEKHSATMRAARPEQLGGNQGGRAGGAARLAPEQQGVVWSMQAGNVASTLGLDGKKSGALTKAYQAMRSDVQSATQEVMESGDRAAMRDALLEVVETNRAKFAKSVGDFLEADQAAKAVAMLGVGSAQWDQQVWTLAEMDLDDKTLDKALTHVNGYVMATDAARQSMSDAGVDRTELRQKMADAREQFNDGMAELLTEEQYETFSRSTRRTGRRGAGGAGAGEGRAPRDAGGQGQRRRGGGGGGDI